MANQVREFTVTDGEGNLIDWPFTVTVKSDPHGGTPALRPITRDDGATPRGNPWTVVEEDGLPQGVFRIGAAGFLGGYQITITQGAFTRVLRHQSFGTMSETDQGGLLDPGSLLTFEEETSSPPSAGAFRANNADLSAATEIYVSKETAGGDDIEARLLELAPGGKTVPNTVVFTSWQSGKVSWHVTGVADDTGFVTLTVDADSHSGSTAFTDLDHFSMQREMSGNDGVSQGITLVFDGASQTDSDPGAGTFRLNHATPASATVAYIDNVEALAGASITALLDSFDDSNQTVKGRLKFVSVADPAIFRIFNVTGSVVDGTGYRKVTIADIGVGAGSFVDGDSFAIDFAGAANDGSNGTNGTPGVDGKFSGTEVIKTSAYTALAADSGKTIILNKGTADTLSFDAAATLGSTWMVLVKNIGAGTWTLDPDGSETIDGAATIELAENESAAISCNGTALRSILKTAGGSGGSSTPHPVAAVLVF